MSRTLPPPSTGPVPDPPPRQARAQITRDSILEAAGTEFATAGYHGASLSRILERSRVTKGALYFHFVSKEAMALAVVDVMETGYRGLVENTAGRELDPLHAAAHLVLDVQDLLAASVCTRAGQRLATEGAVGAERSAWAWLFWQDTFGALFTAARDRGLVRPEVDPVAMGRFVTDVSGGAFTSSQAVSGMADLPERVTYNWEVMFGFMASADWLRGWRAGGGMASVMARYVGPR